jgi:hypothetical protein
VKKLSVLVLPAASRPSMSRRISRDPKILPIILEIWLPMMAIQALLCSSAIRWCDWLYRRATSQLRYGLASADRYACGLGVVAKMELGSPSVRDLSQSRRSQVGVIEVCVQNRVSVSAWRWNCATSWWCKAVLNVR